jgi:hypothetical protein
LRALFSCMGKKHTMSCRWPCFCIKVPFGVPEALHSAALMCYNTELLKRAADPSNGVIWIPGIYVSCSQGRAAWRPWTGRRCWSACTCAGRQRGATGWPPPAGRPVSGRVLVQGLDSCAHFTPAHWRWWCRPTSGARVNEPSLLGSVAARPRRLIVLHASVICTCHSLQLLLPVQVSRRASSPWRWKWPAALRTATWQSKRCCLLPLHPGDGDLQIASHHLRTPPAAHAHHTPPISLIHHHIASCTEHSSCTEGSSSPHGKT